MTEEQQGVLSRSNHAPHKKKHLLAWLLVLLACVVLLAPLLHKSKRSSGNAGGPGMANAGTSVTVSPVRVGTMDLYLDALGTVTPLQTVNVYSQVSGQVLSVNYREGQIVRKGQPLIEIDDRTAKAQLQQGEGSLVRDSALLGQARADLNRYQAAVKEHAISEQTVNDQEATVRQYEGTVQNDEGTVRYYKVQLEYYHITAPASGRIGLRLVDAGNTIFSGSSNTIATITQIDPITVVFSVAEDHVQQVLKQLSANKQGIKVRIFDRSGQNELAIGKLLTIDNQVDTTTGTVKLRAVFDNPHSTLFPNQFVNARLDVGQLIDTKLVPTAAVQYNGQQAFVYVVKPDHTVAMRNVTVLNSQQSTTAIDGVQSGESVVTSNFDRLQDGAKVILPGVPPTAQGAGPAR